MRIHLYQFLCLMVQNDNKDSKIFAFCQLKSIMKTTKKDEDHCENQRKSYEPKKQFVLVTFGIVYGKFIITVMVLCQGSFGCLVTCHLETGYICAFYKDLHHRPVQFDQCNQPRQKWRKMLMLIDDVIHSEFFERL